MKKKLQQMIAIFLTLSLVLGVNSLDTFASVSLGSVGENSIIAKKEYSLVPGITETDITLNNDEGTYQNKGYVMEIDLSNPDVTMKAGYKNYDGSTYGMQTSTGQAEAAEKALKKENPNANVVGIVNANFFNMSTGEPLGALVMNGTVYHDTAAGYAYFAILKDGSAEIRDGKTPLDDNVVEAMAGDTILVKNGKNVIGSGSSYAENSNPRTAVGIREDGSVVLFCVDGRQAPTSCGLSYADVADVMIGLGCVTALNFDGGGSVTFATEREGTNELTVKNSPSDGYERAVSGTLMCVSTAEPSGTFDHAALNPTGTIYTPGSTVEFSAIGVDSAGGSAELPEDLTWTLADNSTDMGEIDESTGVFKATEDVTGTVNIQARSGGNVVGTTSIELRAPDALSFLNESINLDYEQESNLGLTATYNGSEVALKDGDINWSIEDSTAGSFSGNIFKAAANNESHNLSVSTKVTATSKWDDTVTASITVGVGTAPVVVMDGGDADGLDYNNVAYVHAAANGGGLEYETHADDHGDVIVVHYINGNGSSRGGVASAEQVGIDDGEVRFGEKALKLNYDFTGINGIEGACVGFAEDITIEGSPTGIGFWCYAPENTPNLWVRIRVKDGAGTIRTLDFTDRYDQATDGTCGGINWVGWKYLECDLSAVQGPITLLGGETIRIMDTNGAYGKNDIATNAGMGTIVCQKDDSGNIVYGPTYVGHQKGYLYMDNLQLVYGTNNADTDNPTINMIKAGSSLDLAEELAADGSTEINSNEITFYSEFSDIENVNTTGIDLGYIYIDGVNMTENENCAVSLTDGKLTLNGMKLANGTHSVKILVRDGYGNEATVTRTFNVNGTDSSLTAVNLVPVSENAFLGSTYQMALTSNKIEDVKGVDTEIKIGTEYSISNVTFADDYSDSTFEYNESTGILTIHAIRKENASTEGEDRIAVIDVDIPSGLSNGSALTYNVVSGKVTYVSDKDASVINTFATASTRIPIISAYDINIGTMLVGAENGIITVTDVNGNKASNVEVFVINDTEESLGKTNDEGILTTDKFVDKVQSFTVYAKGDDGYSFPVKAQSYSAADASDGTPYYIIENAVTNGSSMQSISWMASPSFASKKAIIKYGTSEDNLDTTKEGECELKSFSGSGDINGNYAVLINHATITGLKSSTDYYYQVGDGEVWSDVKHFSTSAGSKSDTNFFVLGDTQTAVGETGSIEAINEQIAHSSYDFGIQTGDAIESPALYSDWENFLNIFGTGAFSTTDIMHVIGNHEQFGDNGASAANTIFDTPGDYYSIEYGNVYVATLSYTTDASTLKNFAAWLKEDASKSNASWKILAMHQPAYYTNVEGGSQVINDYIPEAVDEAGIDIVFSGHDHSYARTKPMTNGMVDEKNGAVYYICGSTGEKSYAVTANENFNFSIATQDYDAIYLSVSANNDSITVTTYNVSNGTQSIFDTYTLNKYRCEDENHTYVYDSETNTLKCSVCGYEINAEDSKYSGFATDKATGKRMYFVSGQYMTGHQYLSGTHYYFDENGLAYDGEYTIGGETCLFTDGQYTSCSTADVIIAGICGTSAEFVLYENGEFVISGTGAIEKYVSYGVVPWYQYRTSVKSVIISAGITKLTENDFIRCTNLTTVTFEEGSKLTTINGEVFHGCTSLTGIILPENVTTIYGNAFYGCTNLVSVYLPYGVSYIAPSAFKNCTNVVLNVGKDSYAKNFAVTNGIQYIERDKEAIDSGTCGDDVTWSYSSGGLLVLSGSGAMKSYASANEVPWYTYRKSILKVVIGKDITNISNYAFADEPGLSEVEFEEGSILSKIGGTAFYGSSLKEVTLPDTVTTIYGLAFANCSNLENVYIPDGTSFIGASAFKNDSKIVLSVGMNSYSKQFAETNNIPYTERGAEVLGSGSCGNELTWSYSSEGILTISGNGAMESYTSSNVVPWYTYRKSILKVVIGKDITSISNYAFADEPLLSEVEFEEGSKLTKIGGTAFYGSSLSEVTLPEAVTTIYGLAFANCSNLTKIYIPNSVSFIADSTFRNSSNVILSVGYQSYAKSYAERLSLNYTERTIETLASGSCGETVTWTLTTDGNLTLSGNGAVENYDSYKNTPWYEYISKITKLTVGKDITILGDNSFSCCTNLEEVVFEENSSLKKINGSVFYNCKKLVSVMLPDTVTSIYGRAFKNCEELTSLYIPEGVKYIASGVFDGDNKLTLVVIPGSYAEDYAIKNSITYTTMEKDVSSSNTVENSLADFVKEENKDESTLESTELESADTITENNSNDDQLTEGICGENLVWTLNQEGVLTIDGSGKMTDINVKNGESSIWTSYTDEINAIVIGANVESIGAHAFEGLRKVTTVTFAEGSKLTSIGSYAFADCSLLEEFIIPEGTKCIGAAAFKNCNSLKVISIPGSVENFDFLSEVDIEDENATESMIESSFEGCISEEFHILTNAGSLAEAYANTKGIKCEYN